MYQKNSAQPSGAIPYLKENIINCFFLFIIIFLCFFLSFFNVLHYVSLLFFVVPYFSIVFLIAFHCFPLCSLMFHYLSVFFIIFGGSLTENLRKSKEMQGTPRKHTVFECLIRKFTMIFKLFLRFV